MHSLRAPLAVHISWCLLKLWNTLRRLSTLKPTFRAMLEEGGTNHFLLRKYGDTWTAAHLSLMEHQIKELEAQMMLMQRHVDNIQSQMHTLQLLVHRHAYLYSSRRTNKAWSTKVRVLDVMD